MAEVLEAAHAFERHGMPEMQVRSRRIESHLHAQRNALFVGRGEFAQQIVARVHVDRSARHLGELLGGGGAAQEIAGGR